MASEQLSASLTNLARIVTSVHVIPGRGDMDRDLDQRLTGVVAELESLIHDVLHATGSVPDDARTPTRFASSEDASDQIRSEAAFEAWLASDDKPDLWQVDATDGPRTSLTGILGGLVLSRRQLPVSVATELRMPVGTMQGHVATELLLAVNDPKGPRCRSYRSALYFLRDHDDTVDQ